MKLTEPKIDQRKEVPYMGVSVSVLLLWFAG